MRFPKWRTRYPVEAWRQLPIRRIKPVRRNRGLGRWRGVGMGTVDSMVSVPLMWRWPRNSSDFGWARIGTSVAAWQKSREWSLVRLDRKNRWLMWYDNRVDQTKKTKKTTDHDWSLVRLDMKNRWLRGYDNRCIANRLHGLVRRRRRLTMAVISTGGHLI